MAASVELVKKLRAMTSAGVMECRKALTESGGDLEKAAMILHEQGAAAVAAKQGRKAEEGVVMAYVHHGAKLGSLIEVNCESDFVARTEEFVSLAKELAMQVAATNPKYISKDDVPKDILDAERKEFKGQAESLGKGAKVEEYLEEKIEHLLSQLCLMEQPYIRDAAVTVASLITEKVAKFKERIRVKRFVVYKLGETEDSTS
jgi:elongation factor Ts